MSVRPSRPLSLLVLLASSVTTLACSSDDSTPTSVPITQQNSNAFVPPGTGSEQDGGGRGILSGGSTSAFTRDAGLIVVGMDSGTTPAPVTDSGVDAATVAAFACAQNSDCHLTDVGSCCGFRQGCANTAAVFGPPVCTVGEVGLCSFPIIDHCECQQNVCTNILSAVQGSMQF